MRNTMKSYIDVVSMQKQAAISQSLLREKAKRYDEVIGKKAGLADIVAKMKQYFSGKQPAVPVAAPAVPVRQGAPAGYDGLTAEGPIISRGTGYDRARAALEPRPSDMLAPVSMATPTNLINAVQVGDPPESEVRAVTGLDAATPFEKQRINQPVSRAMTNALPVWEKARAAVDNEPYYSPA